MIEAIILDIGKPRKLRLSIDAAKNLQAELNGLFPLSFMPQQTTPKAQFVDARSKEFPTTDTIDGTTRHFFPLEEDFTQIAVGDA